MGQREGADTGEGEGIGQQLKAVLGELDRKLAYVDWARRVTLSNPAARRSCPIAA